MKEKATSKNGVPIRLPIERWEHIIHPEEGHPEVARHYQDILQTVAEPEAVYDGEEGELIAVKEIKPEQYLAVIYKETSLKDGFVITAWLTSKVKQIRKRKCVWPIDFD